MFRKGHRVRHAAMLLVVFFGLVLIIWLVQTYANDDSSTANGALIGAQAETATPVNSTVTLIVTGDHSDVTYTNGYRGIQAKGPFKITLPLANGRNYTIATFNIKPGDSVCTIKINNKEVAISKALGQGDTAGCAIVQDKFTHDWTAASW